jgi:peptidoglycan-associated lipoprotein
MMRPVLLFVVLFIVLIIVIGCTKSYTKVPETAVTPEEKVEEAVIYPGEKEAMEEEVIDEALVPEEEEVTEETLSAKEQAGSIFADILFDYDKYDIRADDRPKLNAIGSFLSNKKEINIVLEGHCDERGTNEYNLALGERRAKATRDYLVSLGVSPDRMALATFGEERPLCSEQTESCWQRNRRAHPVVARPGNRQ